MELVHRKIHSTTKTMLSDGVFIRLHYLNKQAQKTVRKKIAYQKINKLTWLGENIAKRCLALLLRRGSLQWAVAASLTRLYPSNVITKHQESSQLRAGVSRVSPRHSTTASQLGQCPCYILPMLVM